MNINRLFQFGIHHVYSEPIQTYKTIERVRFHAQIQPYTTGLLMTTCVSVFVTFSVCVLVFLVACSHAKTHLGGNALMHVFGGVGILREAACLLGADCFHSWLYWK